MEGFAQKSIHWDAMWTVLFRNPIVGIPCGALGKPQGWHMSSFVQKSFRKNAIWMVLFGNSSLGMPYGRICLEIFSQGCHMDSLVQKSCWYGCHMDGFVQKFFRRDAIQMVLFRNPFVGMPYRCFCSEILLQGCHMDGFNQKSFRRDAVRMPYGQF